MIDGELISIHVAAKGGEPMRPVEEIGAVAGSGLEGDRYSLQTGTYSNKTGPGRQVTLMEAEVFETLKRDYDMDLSFNESRRNLITRGVPLTHLVGKTFQVGDVQFRGVKINEPCAYFEKLVAQPGIEEALLHRSGLNAEVLSDGVLHIGDTVAEVGTS